LQLGPNAELTASGQYYTGSFIDGRPGIDFLDVVQGDKNPGWPIDVAIYLASSANNVNINSPVNPIPPSGGVMVIDAYHKVEPFGSDFLNSLPGIGWLEVCSRTTGTLTEARENDTLPYADDTSNFPGPGAYILRGDDSEIGTGTGAWLLEDVEEPEIDIPIEGVVQASSVEPPVSPSLVDIGQIGDTQVSNLQWLAMELGLCQGDEEGEDETRCQEMAQAYLAGAFLQATDLHPYQAAVQLRNLVETLHDTDGTRIAALVRVVGDFVQAPMPPSGEQMDSIATALALHSNDGTHYAVAGQWLDALTEYVEILNTEIGWSRGESISFVMGKYGSPITEAGNINVVAFVQMHLESSGG
jgi:hypothetical protein